jgi:hypothetical protein
VPLLEEYFTISETNEFLDNAKLLLMKYKFQMRKKKMLSALNPVLHPFRFLKRRQSNKLAETILREANSNDKDTKEQK